jgi:hypothetical protein
MFLLMKLNQRMTCQTPPPQKRNLFIVNGQQKHIACKILKSICMYTMSHFSSFAQPWSKSILFFKQEELTLFRQQSRRLELRAVRSNPTSVQGGIFFERFFWVQHTKTGKNQNWGK